ncbi:MAG TPA: glucose-1-phosphate cytidylyltransferase [Verrucomicrobiota bacterium]|jgi:glucose-1-phosphate cytidylyltransferase|nr:MAG: Glucose-1-phosphate cytidylyltransferase [Verrucomicrobia bacterium ADurb.Bin118]HPY29734.1 glucose-1-phosphate cytidylyltransferase [Verrucomicrobiota bacterium]HQB15513.1 glucose-1-phosphate cytidylyltransferase [Verrucomicrobiota bacterium]
MKVAILCGGKGTRFREVSDVIPKPMAPIGDRPILWHIMKTYSAHGFNDFVLLLGYKGNSIRDFFLNFAAFTHDITIDLSRTDAGRVALHGQSSEPWRVTCVDTGEDAMTGARLWRARRYLEADGMFCAAYGDGVANVDVGALVRFHQAHGKVGTLTGARPPGRFGELSLAGDRVVKFNEKPEFSGHYLNSGFFVFNASIFDRYLNDREDLILEREPLQRMAEDGELMIYKHEGYWHHMDTPYEFELLNKVWKTGRAPWKTWS